MSDSVALGAWRRRAQGGGEHDGRRPPAKAVFTVAVVAAVVGAAFGGRAVHGEGANARTHPIAEAAQPCPVVTALLHADVDGDGCDDEISFADGVLNAGAVRMRVGAPGDQVALGRWTCGAVTVALLRPATGDVFRFDGWATQANAVPAIAVGRVDGAVGLHGAPRDGGRCDDLVVTRTSGPPVLLPEHPVAG